MHARIAFMCNQALDFPIDKVEKWKINTILISALPIHAFGNVSAKRWAMNVSESKKQRNWTMIRIEWNDIVCKIICERNKNPR